MQNFMLAHILKCKFSFSEKNEKGEHPPNFCWFLLYLPLCSTDQSESLICPRSPAEKRGERSGDYTFPGHFTSCMSTDSSALMEVSTAGARRRLERVYGVS